jgi:hypothetical protein
MDQSEVTEVTKVTEVTENVIDETMTDRDLIPAVPFPFEILPERLREMIDTIAEAFHIDPGMVVSCQLPILAAAIGNTIRVSSKEAWKEPIFLWLIIIAPTGYGKSPVLNMLVEPIERRENRLQKFDPSKPFDMPHTISVRPETYLVSDTTVEALSEVFSNSPRGVLIKIDEIAGLVNGLNQYKGKGNDKEHYLELFNCKPWKIDRKTGSKFIPNTGASIVGGIQPREMPKAFENGSFGNGLLPRFLFLTCNSSKPRLYSRKTVTENDLAYWGNIIEYCYNLTLSFDEDNFVSPTVISLSREAVDRYEEFYNEYEVVSQDLSEDARSFVPKLREYRLKLAGVIHVLECFDKDSCVTTTITEESILKAIKITRFFAGQAMNVLDIYKQKELLDVHAPKLIGTILSLSKEVRNGRLDLARIVSQMNTGVEDNQKMNHKTVGSMLRSLGLIPFKSTGNRTFVRWDEDRIQRALFQPKKR